MYVGDWMALMFGVGNPNLYKWQEPTRVRGPKLTDAQISAHARAWLKGGAGA